MISLSTCERAARRLADDPHVGTALILPVLPFGVTQYGAAFPGAISIEPTTLGGVVVDSCRSLMRYGLGRVVLVNNHFEPEHVGALRTAVAELNDDGAAVALLDLLRRRNVERLTDEFRSGEAHAGRYETSIVLADHPALVDVEQMKQLPHVKVDMAKAISDGLHSFAAMGMDRGYCGAPAEATADEGEQTLATLSDLVVEVARTLVRR
jgi:creatinine amidohydrolase